MADELAALIERLRRYALESTDEIFTPGRCFSLLAVVEAGARLREHAPTRGCIDCESLRAWDAAVAELAKGA